MIFVGFMSLLPPPTWKAENEQCDGHVFHSASAAAIFMGWYVPSTTPSSLPTNRIRNMVGTRITRAIPDVRLKASTSCSRFRCHADTANMMRHPATAEANRTWTYPHRNVGLV